MSDINLDEHSLVQWLDYQQELHPENIELGLNRIRVVAGRLQLAPVKSVCIVVAGTNGKGSSIAMLEAIYGAAGYRVGCYTSPHLYDYCERVRIDGVAASEQSFCAAFKSIEQARGTTELTFFEFGTLAALKILSEQALDIVLLEVGLGGRLDAVNIVDADLALITQIDIDHRDWLGDSRETIGAEKAGIMRRGRPVVCADSSAPHSVVEHARQLGAELFLAGAQFSVSECPPEPGWSIKLNGTELRLPRPALVGSGQVENAAAVVQVVELLQLRLPVSTNEVADGLVNVTLPGRFEYREGSPSMILDVAHNPQACRELAENLGRFPPVGKRIAVLGMLVDKDISACLQPLLDLFDRWCLASLTELRGATASELQATLIGLGSNAPITLFDSVPEAVQQAHALAQPDDQLVVFGSFHTVGMAG